MLLLAIESYLRIFGLLVFISGVLLPTIVECTGLVFPSARIAGGVLSASHARFSVLLLKSRWPFAAAFVGAIILGVKLGLTGAAEAVLTLDRSHAQEISDAIAILIFYLWVSYGTLSTAGYNLLVSGLEGGDAAIVRARIRRMSFQWLSIIGAVAWLIPGPYGSVGCVTALVATLVATSHALHEIAGIRRGRAPRATDLVQQGRLEPSLLLQISDIHATASGSRRTDGSPDGSASLRALAEALAKSPPPSFLLVTGDIVDRGSPEEWAGVLPVLHKLRSAGSRVLLTPGNHDLATAYEPAFAERFMSLADGAARPVDAEKLLAYLEHAADLEPKLQTYGGALLSEVAAEARQPVVNLAARWAAAREHALGVLRKDPAVDAWIMRRLEKQGPIQVFSDLWISSPSEFRRILNEMVDEAERVFRPAGREPMTATERATSERLFRYSPDWQLSPTLLGRHWMKLWHKLFPLRLVVGSSELEFLILNSNAPEPGLLGSAFGQLGHEQIEQLRSAVASTSAQVLIVLMHHPICGWVGEAGDDPASFRVSSERWALLAHDSVEARELVGLLENAAPPTCRQIFLCSGHRHGHSHAGPIQLGPKSLSSRLWVLESAALPDLHRPNRKRAQVDGLLALDRDPAGRFIATRVCSRQPDGGLCFDSWSAGCPRTFRSG